MPRKIHKLLHNVKYPYGGPYHFLNVDAASDMTPLFTDVWCVFQ